MGLVIPDELKVEKPLEQGRRIALVVSNGTYTDPAFPDLFSTTKDNRDLSKLLSEKDLGDFEVTSLIDENLISIRKAICKVCIDATADDVVLFYYSGSCYLDNQRNLYLPARDSESKFLTATSVEADYVLSQMRHSLCKRFVLIIDGCHSGAFFNNNRGVPDGMIALTSCGEEELCYETAEGGVFTQAIVNGIRGGKVDKNNDGFITPSELFDHIKRTIRNSTYNFNPQKWEWNLRDSVYIVQQPKAVFVSYAREEQSTAQALAKLLEEAGIRAFVDTKGLSVGGEWKEELVDAIISARGLIFIISESSLDSKWAKRELSLADSKDIPIYPLMIGEVNLPDWYQFQYSELNFYKIDPNSLAESVVSLIEDILNFTRDMNEPQVEAR